MSQFVFEIADRSGEVIGEVQDAQDRHLELALSATSSASFKIHTKNPLLDELYSGDRVLRVWRFTRPTASWDLLFNGPILTLEAASDSTGPTVTCSAADPTFFFSKRLIGILADWTATYTGILYNSVDKVAIIADAVAKGNVQGETGLTVAATNCGTTSVYIAGPYRPLNEIVQELGDSVDSYEWKVNPNEYAAGKIGEFEIAATIGATKASAAFEYGAGTRANIAAFNYQKSWTDMANYVVNLPVDIPATSPDILAASDSGSITEHGKYEVLADLTDVTNDTLRQAVIQYHVDVRKEPRQIVTFTPEVNPTQDESVPLFGYDYGLGDTVPVRIKTEDTELVNGGVRVYKMVIDIDNAGRASYTPTTVLE